MQSKIKNSLLICIIGVLITNVFAEPVTVKQPVSNQLVGQVDNLKALPVTEPAKPQNLLSQAQPEQSYMIELPVSDDGNVQRQQSFVKALGLILTKNSNNPEIVSLPEIKTALSNSGRYVQRFNYINRSITADKQDLFLQINFDPKAITQLLQRTSKVVWVNSKPITLVWFAKDVSGSKILDNESSSDETADILKKKAREFGMTTILPTFDLQDMNSVKVNDICSLNAEKIKLASRRYGTSVIVVGCVKPPILKGDWSSKWLLLRDNKKEIFNFTAAGIEDAITKAMREIAANIVSTATPVVDGQATKVVIRVTNVNGLDQYNEVVRYLHTFNQIKQIDLVNISSTEIELAVNTIGGQPVLLNVLGGQNKLVPNVDVKVSPPGIDLDYKWVTLDNEKPQTINPGSLS